MLQKAFVPFDKFFIEYNHFNIKNNMKVQHYHDTYEIYLQISGERNLFLDNICYTLKRGDLVILNPFEIHLTQGRDIDYYERYVMNFSPENLAFFLTKEELKTLFMNFESCVIHLNKEHTETFHNYFKKADILSGKSGFLSEKLLYSVVFQLIMMIKELSEKSEVLENEHIQPEIVTAINYINKHYNESIDLNTCSNMVHLSRYHFSRIFHTATGATFLEYLYNVRLTKVHKMLLETDLALNKIADITGFSSTAHLSRIFRQVYDMSPKKFRKINSRKI